MCEMTASRRAFVKCRGKRTSFVSHVDPAIYQSVNLPNVT